MARLWMVLTLAGCLANGRYLFWLIVWLTVGTYSGWLSGWWSVLTLAGCLANGRYLPWLVVWLTVGTYSGWLSGWWWWLTLLVEQWRWHSLSHRYNSTRPDNSRTCQPHHSRAEGSIFSLVSLQISKTSIVTMYQFNNLLSNILVHFFQKIN